MARLSAACCRVAASLLLLSGAHAFQLPLPRSSVVADDRPTAFADEVHRRTRVGSSAPIAGSETRGLPSTTTSSRGGVTPIFSNMRPDDAATAPSLLPTKVTRTDHRLASAIRTATPIAASTLAVWTATISAALAAASDEVEMAELPPPYVPAVFAVVLLGGVGWFTASLGNVMDEEASLGLQSGAKAKKEMERSRSSYFKKK
jgi:hypothetical protein